ncbi:MAG: hypothetical protein AAGG51_26365 [Cyanobacteria bacterium P01_G01_bin.54]
MTQRQAKDFWIWLLLLALTLIIVVWGLGEWNPMIHTDSNGLTLLIFVLFVMALIINVINTLYVFFEFNNLKRFRGLFSEHIHSLKRAAKQSISIDQEFSISLIENRLLRRESWVQLSSNLMITLGMIGTVLGLTTSMAGLQSAMNKIELTPSSLAESDLSNLVNSPIDGLTQALSGMSSAFLTTLLGSILGGFFLKALSHSTVNLIEDLLDNIRYKTELEYMSGIRQQIWEREITKAGHVSEKLRSFIGLSGGVEKNLKMIIKELNDATNEMNKFTNSLSQGIGESEKGYLLGSIKDVIKTQNDFTFVLIFALVILTLVSLYQMFF